MDDFGAYPLDIPDDEIVLIPTPTKNKVLDVDPDAVGVDTVPRMILVEASITDGSPIFASYSGVPSFLSVGDWVILDNDGLDTEPRVTGGVSVPSVTPVAPAWLDQTPFTSLITGGLLSITDAGATYKISAGTGRIVDYSNPAQPPTITEMTWGDITGLTVSPTGEYTSIALDYISSVVTVVTKDDAPWSQSEQRRLVVIGNVVHVGTTITEVTSDPVPAYNFPHGVMDFFNATGGLYNDFVIHTTNANRTFQQDEGTYTSPFVNYANDIMSPSTIQHPAFDPKDFLYSMRDGVGGFMFTVPVNGNEVDPLYWDDGTGTLNTLGNNRWTFQPVYFFGGVAKLILVYGQKEYAKRGDAETGIVEDFEELILDPTLNRSRIFGFFLLKKGATDLTNDSEAEFVSVFQVFSGGGATETTTFDQLTDTPLNKTGAAGKLVSVNAGETDLEYTDPAADSGYYARVDNTWARTRFDENIDVSVLGATDGQGVAWNSTTMIWEPVDLGASSPLTTKGDLYGYSTADDRIPVGAFGESLTVDAAESTGVKWKKINTFRDTAQYQLAFNDSTAGGDPGSGKVALNQINPSLATEMYISEVDRDGHSRAWLLDQVVSGTQLTVMNESQGSEAALFTASGAPVDSGAWRTIPLTYVDHTSALAGNSNVVIGVTSGGGGGGDVLYTTCNGRLTLTSGNPVTTSDVTGATTVYFTPYRGNKISLYDGNDWKLFNFTELSLALGTLTSNLPYDVFVYDNSGTLTLEALAWTNGTTRATSLATQDGVYCKTGALDRRYLGTFYTTSTTTTEDSETKRVLWNYYNRIPKKLLVQETANSWSYSGTSYRSLNNSTANRVEIIQGVSEDVITFTAAVSVYNDAGNGNAYVNLGVDSTSINAAQIVANSKNNAALCYYKDFVVAGYHYLQILEATQSGNTYLFYGDAGLSNKLQSGGIGEILC